MDRIVQADVAVVGAGPAGCRAAWTLARLGRKTVVLDRARFPRWKPCAGGITRKGFDLVPPELRRLVRSSISEALVVYRGEARAVVRVDPALGWLVHRESFDRAHLDLVREQPGIGVLEGVEARALRDLDDGVEVVAGGLAVRARAVLGADGTEGISARHLRGHADRRFGLAYEAEIGPPPSRADTRVLFDFGALPRGYGWLFPKGDHCSAGVYARDPVVPGIAERCRAFTTRSGVAPDRPYSRARGHRVPRGGERRDLHGRRIVLAGDAAGLVDSLSGEGIAFALRSGELAAHALHDFLRDGRPLEEYTRTVERDIRGDLRRGDAFARLVYRFPRFACRSFERSPRLCRAVAEVLAGERSYRDLSRRLLSRGWMAPRLLARRAGRGSAPRPGTDLY